MEARNPKQEFLNILMQHIREVVEKVTKDINGKEHNFIDCMARLRNEHLQNGKYDLGLTGRLFDDPVLDREVLEKMPQASELLKTYPFLCDLNQQAATIFEEKVFPILQVKWKKSPPIKKVSDESGAVVVSNELMDLINAVVIKFVEPLQSDPAFDLLINDLAKNSIEKLHDFDHERLKGKAYDLVFKQEKDIYRDVILQSLAFKLVNPMVLAYSMNDKFKINKKDDEDNFEKWRMVRKAMVQATNNYHADFAHGSPGLGARKTSAPQVELPRDNSATDFKRVRKSSEPDMRSAELTISPRSAESLWKAGRRKSKDKRRSSKGGDKSREVTPRSPKPTGGSK